MQVTARDLITTAYRELSIADSIDALPAELASEGLDIVNRILDNWQADPTISPQLSADLLPVDLDHDFELPFGFRNALTETLKERLASLPKYASAMTPEVKDTASKARATAFKTTKPDVTLQTRDAGLPGGYRTWFDPATRTWI